MALRARGFIVARVGDEGLLSMGSRPGRARQTMARQAIDGAVAECTLPEAVHAAKPGHHVLYDDGKIDAVVERAEPWGAVARVERCAAKGIKLKSEKGLNFPDTDFAVDAL